MAGLTDRSNICGVVDGGQHKQQQLAVPVPRLVVVSDGPRGDRGQGCSREGVECSATIGCVLASGEGSISCCSCQCSAIHQIAIRHSVRGEAGLRHTIASHSTSPLAPILNRHSTSPPTPSTYQRTQTPAQPLPAGHPTAAACQPPQTAPRPPPARSGRLPRASGSPLCVSKGGRVQLSDVHAPGSTLPTAWRVLLKGWRGHPQCRLRPGQRRARPGAGPAAGEPTGAGCGQVAMPLPHGKGDRPPWGPPARPGATAGRSLRAPNPTRLLKSRSAAAAVARYVVVWGASRGPALGWGRLGPASPSLPSRSTNIRRPPSCQVDRPQALLAG